MSPITAVKTQRGWLCGWWKWPGVKGKMSFYPLRVVEISEIQKAKMVDINQSIVKTSIQDDGIWILNESWIPTLVWKTVRSEAVPSTKRIELYCSLLSDSGISMCPWMENASNIYPQHIPNLGKYTINGARGPQRKIQVGHYDETNWAGSNDVECTKMWQG